MRTNVCALVHWSQFSDSFGNSYYVSRIWRFRGTPNILRCQLNADTGSKSPSCALMGRTTSLMNAGSLFSTLASSGRLAQAGSTVSCCTRLRGQRLHWVLVHHVFTFPRKFTMNFFICSAAKSTGITPVMRKNADWRIDAGAVAKPISCAICVALI